MAAFGLTCGPGDTLLPLVTDYNYSVFDLEREQPVFAEYRSKLFVGERHTSFPLEDLATGETVPMSDWWQRGLAVLEFGSLT